MPGHPRRMLRFIPGQSGRVTPVILFQIGFYILVPPDILIPTRSQVTRPISFVVIFIRRLSSKWLRGMLPPPVVFILGRIDRFGQGFPAQASRHRAHADPHRRADRTTDQITSHGTSQAPGDRPCSGRRRMGVRGTRQRIFMVQRPHTKSSKLLSLKAVSKSPVQKIRDEAGERKNAPNPCPWCMTFLV